jgi:hypothetical protein
MSVWCVPALPCTVSRFFEGNHKDGFKVPFHIHVKDNHVFGFKRPCDV